jgi:hypothetical protein
VSVTLDDARDKLRWAKHHFEMLRPYIEAFEQRDSHTFTYEIDANEGKYTFYVHGLEMVDPDWGLVIGDCLHNARTALDYLLVRLVSYVTGEDPAEVKTVSFPIFDDPKDFGSRVGSLRKNLVLNSYLTRIEELQPFGDSPNLTTSTNTESSTPHGSGASSTRTAFQAYPRGSRARAVAMGWDHSKTAQRSAHSCSKPPSRVNGTRRRWT